MFFIQPERLNEKTFVNKGCDSLNYIVIYRDRVKCKDTLKKNLIRSCGKKILYD